MRVVFEASAPTLMTGNTAHSMFFVLMQVEREYQREMGEVEERMRGSASHAEALRERLLDSFKVGFTPCAHILCMQQSYI
jgi:hypothetical protein